MAALPSKHPRLALHLTDRALTPIISSATTPSPSSSATYDPAASSSQQGEHQERLAALASLSSTALTSYDAAKRLEMGAPLRTMVEHPDSGPVVLHSYLCPMGLALGTPGRNASSTSLQTMMPGWQDSSTNDPSSTAHIPTNGDDAEALASNTRQRSRTNTALAIDSDTETEGGASDSTEGPNVPPMLMSIVVAPGAEDLGDARRAAGRLERIARSFQTEWVAENNDHNQRDDREA